MSQQCPILYEFRSKGKKFYMSSDEAYANSLYRDLVWGRRTYNRRRNPYYESERLSIPHVVNDHRSYNYPNIGKPHEVSYLSHAGYDYNANYKKRVSKFRGSNRDFSGWNDTQKRYSITKPNGSKPFYF